MIIPVMIVSAVWTRRLVRRRIVARRRLRRRVPARWRWIASGRWISTWRRVAAGRMMFMLVALRTLVVFVLFIAAVFPAGAGVAGGGECSAYRPPAAIHLACSLRAELLQPLFLL